MTLRAFPRSLRGSIAAVTTGACLLAPGTASAQDFLSVSWLDLTKDGAALEDASNDSFGPGIVDLVGATGAPAASIAGDASFVYLRLRVDGNPTDGDGLASSGWGCAIDNDGNYGAYEFMIFVDGQTDTVELWDNLSAPGDGPGDAADTQHGSYPVATHARVVAAGAPDLGSPEFTDHYVEIAVPTMDLIGAGFDPTGPIVAVCGSSTSGAAVLSADCSATDASCNASTIEEVGTDPLLCGLAGCAVCNTDAACGNLCAPCANPTPSCDAASMTCLACADDDDCFSPTPSCVTEAGPDLGSCVECTADTDCAEGETCDLATHVCEFHCTVDTDCAAPTAVCETVSGECVECTAANTTACDAAEFCEVDSGACVECLADGDCGGDESGRVCLSSGACADGCRGTGNGCPDPLVCNSADDSVGACVPANVGGAGGGGGAAGAPVTAGAAGAPVTAGAAGTLVVAGAAGVPTVAGAAGTLAAAGSAGAPVVATGGTQPATGGTTTGGAVTGGVINTGGAEPTTGGSPTGGVLTTGGTLSTGGVATGGTLSEGGEGGEDVAPAGGSPTGGTAPRTGGSGPDDVDTTPDPVSVEGGGCDCATPRQNGGAAWLLLALPALVAARRRRRRA